MFSLFAAAKRNDDGTYDAEVALSLYGENSKIVASTRQRHVSAGHPSQKAAEDAALKWIIDNIFPVMEKLKKAKP